MNIYFDRASLLDHLANLEEDNLFKIHLVQEDEQALEVMKTDISENILSREHEIADVRKNIEMLENSKAVLVSKQVFLESGMKVKQTGGHHKLSAADLAKAAYENSMINEEKSALVMLQQYTGCPMDLITTLSNKITFMLESVLKNTHEDKTNKIEMLRKIESELWYMSEKREYIAGRPKQRTDPYSNNNPPELEELEAKVAKERKDKRRSNAQEREDAIRREKQEKNDQKKLK
jgi:hypothetical protein